jgi:hypothetical protein
MILLQATLDPLEALAPQATLVLREAPASQVQQVILSKLHILQFYLQAAGMCGVINMCTSSLFNIVKGGTQDKRMGCLINSMLPLLQATLVALAPRV